MDNNVPDDWNEYWTTCEYCGHKWHLSEGSGCVKCKEEKEEWLEKHCMECEKELEKKDFPFPITINGEKGLVCCECQSEMHH